MSQPPQASPRLADVGQIYVTLGAATRYAEQRRLRPEEARRELTELLLDARRVGDDDPPRYRARSRTTQVDVTARVAREGRLLVVVTINARDYR